MHRKPMKGGRDRSSVMSSSRGRVLSLNEDEILPLAKGAKEKLLLMNDELSKKLETLFSDSDDTNVMREGNVDEYNHLKSIISRTQLGVYNSHLLITLAEYLRTLEKSRRKLYNDVKKMQNENMTLRESIHTLQEDIISEEAELSIVQEEVSHWTFMNSVSKADAAEAVLNQSLDPWISCIFPEIGCKSSYNNTSITPELSEVQSEMMSKLLCGTVTDAEAIIKRYVNQHSDVTDLEALALIWLAKYCADRNNFKQAIDFLKVARNSRAKRFGDTHPSVIEVLNFLALYHWRNDDLLGATSYAYKAFCHCEKRMKRTEDEVVAIQSLRVGYLLTKWNYPNDGIKMMEFAMRTVEKLLPGEEPTWILCATALIRSCNDIGAYLNALTLCCEVIDYFYESRIGDISDENLPIYEVAAWHQVCATSSVEMPPPPKQITLPEFMVGIIRELIIIFINFYFFTGTLVIDSWLDECTILPPKWAITRNRPENDQSFFKIIGKVKIEESKIRAVQVRYGKRIGWMEKAIASVNVRNFEMHDCGDVLEDWTASHFAKIRKKLQSRIHSRASAILKKAANY